MESGYRKFPAGALAVAWFGQNYSKIQVVKDNRKELHPVPLYEEDSDEEDRVDEFQDTDEDPASDEELFMYAQQCTNSGQSDVISAATEKTTATPKYRQLCYYVQTLGPNPLYRWVPAADVRAAEGSQPFRPGVEDAPNVVSYYTNSPGSGILQQKTFKMDPLLPFKVNPTRCNDTKSLKKRKREEHSSLRFLENSKRLLYDNCNKQLDKDHRLLNSRATLDGLLYDARDKHELVVADVMSERDVQSYFDLWRRHFSSKSKTSDAAGQSPVCCVVCEKASGRLRVCPCCPAVYHLPCRKQWLIQIIHGTSPPRKPPVTALSTYGPGSPGAAPPVELRDVLPCAACVWEHRPSEKRWYMRVWPTTSSDTQLNAPPDKQPRL